MNNKTIITICVIILILLGTSLLLERKPASPAATCSSEWVGACPAIPNQGVITGSY